MDIEKLFKSFENQNILVIGDVMIDSYMWGKVERISPEAPIPIVTCNKQETRLGGAANVALNVQSLGATPYLCGVVGDDEKSREFFELLQDQKLASTGIIQDPSRPTTVKTRIISEGQHLLRVDEESDASLEEDAESFFVKNIQKMLREMEIHAIIFEDYDKGVISQNLITKVVRLANKQNIPTLADPKKRNFNHYKGVTLFKPNFKELKEGLKIDLEKDDEDGINNAACLLQQNLKAGYILITLSEKGVYICDPKSYYNIPAEVRDIADVSGAGDTLISTAALCLAAGLDTRTIGLISNLAGGLVCERVGVVPIDKEILKEELKRVLE